VVKAAIAELCTVWFDGQDVVFPKQRSELNSQIECAGFLATGYNSFDRDMPCWAAIELETDEDSIRPAVSKLVRTFVAIARSEVLVANGEVLAARQLARSHLIEQQ
jgi:hypothetical protein